MMIQPEPTPPDLQGADATPPLAWDAEDEWLGARVRMMRAPWPREGGQDDPWLRLVPVLPPDPLRAAPLADALGGRRRRWHAGGLGAAPAAVLSHGGSLLCIDIDRTSRLPKARPWSEGLDAGALLRAVCEALVVSAATQRPTVALRRTADALWQFDPGSPLLECLASNVGRARRLEGCAAEADLDARDWARHSIAELMKLPGLQALPRARGFDER